MRHHRRFDWAKFLFIGGLIVLIIAAIGIYAKSLSPYQQLRDQAEKIATNRADLKNVNGFWWYNRDKSYLTVAGQTKKNQSVYVVIRKEKQTETSTGDPNQRSQENSECITG